MRVPALLAASLLPAFPCVAPAQTVPELEPIIITATRTEVPADKTSAAVTVITREEIARSQARSVQDLLSGTPGMGVSNNGGPGKVTSIHLRGTEADHVLVMIDGVKIGSATLGTVAFQDLPVGLIERIEIVRGPRASLYGSEAIGGVIQIFTKKGGAQRTEYCINDDWRTQLKLENVFDTDYETAYFYNQPGHSVFVALRYEH
jgi:vitamin B12 transporter